MDPSIYLKENFTKFFGWMLNDKVFHKHFSFIRSCPLHIPLSSYHLTLTLNRTRLSVQHHSLPSFQFSLHLPFSLRWISFGFISKIASSTWLTMSTKLSRLWRSDSLTMFCLMNTLLSSSFHRLYLVYLCSSLFSTRFTCTSASNLFDGNEKAEKNKKITDLQIRSVVEQLLHPSSYAVRMAAAKFLETYLQRKYPGLASLIHPFYCVVFSYLSLTVSIHRTWFSSVRLSEDSFRCRLHSQPKRSSSWRDRPHPHHQLQKHRTRENCYGLRPLSTVFCFIFSTYSLL